ncbi:terpene synthase family protein [Nocardia gipuzkoensis]
MTATQPFDVATPQPPVAEPQVAVYCPFPLRTHPCDIRAIDDHAVVWCLDQGLCEPASIATRMGCAAGIAPALPHAPDSTILAATKWFLFGSLLDDHWDAHPHLEQIVAHAGVLQSVMADGPDVPLPPGDRWAAALRDLRGQLENVLTDTEILWFRVEFATWLNGQERYTALQRRPTPPSLGTYLRTRWAKCGVGTLLPFTPAAMGCPLSPRAIDDPPVHAFVKATMTATILLNDLYSIVKEQNAGTATTNLITVLTHNNDFEPAAALTETWWLYERTVALAWHLQQQLRTDPRPAVARLAIDLPNWIPAGIHWAASTPRYHQHATSTTTSSPSAHMILSTTPVLVDPDDLTPPPYPEIAGWWKYAIAGSR